VPEASGVAGTGNCLGVTPSISRWPSGKTITRSNVILVLNPPSDSDAASVVGSIGCDLSVMLNPGSGFTGGATGVYGLPHAESGVTLYCACSGRSISTE
jgi:hypothetical protein